MPPGNRKHPKRAPSSESQYSIMEFMQEYPDDATCLEALWRRRYSPDGEHTEDDIRHPSKDWNALMAAVAKLESERPDVYFYRGSQTWSASHSGEDFDHQFWFDTGDSTSEALAVAKLIHAVVKNE